MISVLNFISYDVVCIFFMNCGSLHFLFISKKKYKHFSII